MPLPLILGIAAGVAALSGIGAGINGGVKLAKANDTMKAAEKTNNDSIKEFEELNSSTTAKMDSLGKYELEILDSFNKFSDLFEKIHNKPEFNEIEIEGAKIPEYNPEKIKEVSVGAAVLLGGLGGAAAGVAGGFAAAGGATAAVMALGTASTGTAIATLSGAAATNATLAALGGGALAAGGGGMALGTSILGVSTAGVAILVGGIIFSITGEAISQKAGDALKQAEENREKIEKVCVYLRQLYSAGESFYNTLDSLNKAYEKHLKILDVLVNFSQKTDYSEYSDKEKIMLENTVLFVALLYKLCQVNLVIRSEGEEALNTVNFDGTYLSMGDAKALLEKVA